MPEDAKKAIKDADFVFENAIVKIVANRNSPAIELPEMTVGPFTEGKEYEVRFWVAKELNKAGIVRIRMERNLLAAVIDLARKGIPIVYLYGEGGSGERIELAAIPLEKGKAGENGDLDVIHIIGDIEDRRDLEYLE